MCVNDAMEAIKKALNSSVHENRQLLEVIYGNKVDFSKADRFVTLNLNKKGDDSTICYFLADGYVIFRIQSEACITGYEMRVYMVKLKK